MATFHGKLDDLVRARLATLAESEPDMAGRIDDALDDITATVTKPSTPTELVPVNPEWLAVYIAGEFRRAGFTPVDATTNPGSIPMVLTYPSPSRASRFTNS